MDVSLDILGHEFDQSHNHPSDEESSQSDPREHSNHDSSDRDGAISIRGKGSVDNGKDCDEAEAFVGANEGLDVDSGRKENCQDNLGPAHRARSRSPGEYCWKIRLEGQV